MYAIINRVRRMCYDNEGLNDFTPEQQEVFNAALARDRREHERKTREAVAAATRELQQKVNELAEKATLSDTERSELQQYQEKYLDEAAKFEKREAARQKQLADAEAKAEAAEKKYSDHRIKSEFLAACSSTDAEVWDGNQLYQLLSDRFALVPATDKQGRPIPEADPVVRVRMLVDDSELPGEKTETLLPIDHALELLKLDQSYANQFRSSIAGGAGSHSGSGLAGLAGQVGAGKVDVRKLAHTPGGQAAYMQLRKTPEGRRQLGLE